MKKFTTLLLAILMVLPAMAEDIPAGKKLYFDVEKINHGNERYAAYFFDNNGNEWVSMTQTLGSIYEVASPAGYDKVIFCRMNGADLTNGWDQKWDQTDDLGYDGTNNLFISSKAEYGKIQGSWSVYEPVVDGLKDITVYLKMNNVSATNIYYWGDKQNTWPGDEMEVKTVEGIDYYSYTFDGVRSVNRIFNNNEGQTVDITNVTEDSYYTLAEKNGDKYNVTKGVPEKLAENITYNNSYLLRVKGDGFDWTADNAKFGAWFYNNNLGYDNGILVEGYPLVVKEDEVLTEVDNFVLFYLDEHHVNDYLERNINFTGVVFLRLPNDFVVSDYVTFPKTVWNSVTTDDCLGPQYYFKLTGMEAGTWDLITNATGVNRVEMAGGIGYAYGVVSAEGAIEVYNVNGAVVARGNDTIDLRGLGRGVYIIRNGNQVRKVVR